MTAGRQASTVQSRKLDQRQETEAHQHDEVVLANQEIKSNNQILHTHTDLILALTKVATTAATQEQTEELKQLMLKVLKANLQMYEMVVSMQATLPLKVERQQPVLFLDACGRLSPIHLEFITSAEAFLAVLKIRFKDAGMQKIEKGQFILEEARTKRLLDLRRPWNTCFFPGRRVDMSMVFSEADNPTSACPGCQYESINKTTDDVEW